MIVLSFDQILPGCTAGIEQSMVRDNVDPLFSLMCDQLRIGDADSGCITNPADGAALPEE